MINFSQAKLGSTRIRQRRLRDAPPARTRRYRARWCLLVAVIFASCATRQMPSSSPNTQAKVDLARLDPGTILITPDPTAATIVVGPPNRKTQSMGEGAEDAARSFLNTPDLGNPQLEAGVGALQFALSPFAAAYGAISASQRRLTDLEMAQAQEELAQTMRTNARPELLIDQLAEVARQKTRRLIVCSGDASARESARPAPVSATLAIAVRHFELNAAKSGGSQYVLSIGVHMQLVRTSDRKTLLERSYQFASGPGLFADWTRQGGMESVANTGFRVLAEEIAGDVFEPATQPAILIGPEQRPSSAFRPRPAAALLSTTLLRQWAASAQLVRPWALRSPRPRVELALLRLSQPPGPRPMGSPNAAAFGHGLSIRPILWRSSTAKPPLEFISLQQQEPASLEVHTSRAEEQLRSPKPGPESGGDSSTMTDTKWSLDGLEYDRNAVVQALSCVAAVPMGLWEQTLGSFHKRSQDKTDELLRGLNAASTQEGFEGVLADEVARCLQSRATAQIKRTDEPLRLAFAGMSQASRAAAKQAETAAESSTALEIQVLRTRLVGKHRNSRSRAVYVEIQATIFRTSDGQELYSCPIQYRSLPRRLKDWAASDAKLFHQELEACSRQAAQALANDLIARGLVTPLPASNSTPADFRKEE